jgi:DNA-binding NarL/FixJ family response regulator
MTALVARDGDTALTLVERVKPDIVILDAVMPGMSGFETCRRLKSRPTVAAVPVIFMTGLSESDHVLEGLRAGGVDYLTKPINPDELVARIAIHIANARMVEDARRALDATGQSILALRDDGTVSWASPGASLALEAAFAGTAQDTLEQEISVRRWVTQMRSSAVSQSTDLKLGEADGGRCVKLSMVGRSAAGDLLVRAVPCDIENPEAMLSRDLGLSLREGEVLYWLCQGKTNKDIAQILDLSPRTVMKHVEQLFAKLQVENRTAAASIGLRVLMRIA